MATRKFNKMRPLYIIEDADCKLLIRYQGVAFGNYRFDVLEYLKGNVLNYLKGRKFDFDYGVVVRGTLSIPKTTKDNFTIRELTPVEQILYGRKNKKG